MRVLIENGQHSEASHTLHRRLAERLTARGYSVDLTASRARESKDLERYSALLSNQLIPYNVRSQLACWGGYERPRTWSLPVMEEFGLPVMPWARARSPEQLEDLFERWQTDRLLLKRSYTFGGRGVTVFEPSFVSQLEWNADVDIFCPEVNPDDGDVYKAELFGGHTLITWMSASPPLHTVLDSDHLTDIRGAYGMRRLCDFEPALVQRLERSSRGLTAMGLGHVSVDLMRTTAGDFKAIELNLYDIATWWTSQFDFFTERYAHAVHEQLRALRDSRDD